ALDFLKMLLRLVPPHQAPRQVLPPPPLGGRIDGVDLFEEDVERGAQVEAEPAAVADLEPPPHLGLEMGGIPEPRVVVRHPVRVLRPIPGLGDRQLHPVTRTSPAAIPWRTGRRATSPLWPASRTTRRFR